MSDGTQSEWLQFKKNPYIEKNSKTLKFRCTSCNMDLGINPGGASSHSKSAHKIRLDGSAPEIVKTPSVEPKRVETGQTKPVQTSASDMFIQSISQRHTRPVRIPDSEEIRQREISRETEYKISIWSKIEDCKRRKVPDNIIAPLYKELGIDPEQERRIKENADKEKRKKKLKELDMEYLVYSCLAQNEQSQRLLNLWYILERKQI